MPSVDALGSREALLKAAIRPEAKLVSEGQVHAVKLREGMKKAGQSESPVDDLDKSLEATKPVNPDRARKLIDRNVGTDVDAKGERVWNKKADREARKKLQGLEEVAREMTEEGGIDKLIAAGKGDQAIELAEIALTADPEMAALLPDKATDPVARRDEIIAFLKQPGMAQKIKAEYNARFKEDAKLADEVSPAREALKKAQEAERLNKEALDKNKKDLGTTTAELEQFDPGKTKALKLDRLTADLPTIESNLELSQYNLDTVSKQIDRLNLARINAIAKDPAADVSTLDTEITTKEAERIKYAGEVKGYKAQIQEKLDLETEKSNLEATKKRLEDEVPTLEEQLREATAERITKKLEFDEKLDERADQEQAFADNVRNVITQAVAKQVRENLTLGKKVQDEELQKLESETVDQIEKAFYRTLRTRYEEPRKPGFVMSNKGETQPNKVNINQDYEDLVSLDPAKGSEVVMRRLLDEGLQATVADPAERARIIDEKMKDAVFVKNTTSTMVETIAAAKLRIGKLKPAEVRTIMDTWGGDMLDKARKKNTDLDAQLAKLTGEGVIDKTLFRKLSDSKLLRILMLLLLGGVVVAGLGIAGPALAGGIGSAAGRVA